MLAVRAIGEVLVGTSKTFLTTGHLSAASDNATLALAKRGMRVSVVSLSVSVHGDGDKKFFVPLFINIARKKGFSFIKAHLKILIENKTYNLL